MITQLCLAVGLAVSVSAICSILEAALYSVPLTHIEIMNKKGVASFIKKVKGGGKTWYVVRISEFPDKASAAAFGKKLKAENVIDDFFVSNK